MKKFGYSDIEPKKTRVRVRVSERALVKISGSREQINIVLDALVEKFGKSKVVFNYPSLNERTGFYYLFANIFLPEEGQ